MNTPNALPKTTLIWAPGTWEADAADTAGENPAEDRAFGLGLWLVDWRFPNRLNRNRWSFKILVPPGYTGSFGPIPGGGNRRISKGFPIKSRWTPAWTTPWTW